MTLVEFLLARIAEDEGQIARAERSHEVWAPMYPLAECESKRAIVEWAAPLLENWPSAVEGFRYVSDEGLELLKLLSLPYADHPDCRDEWKP